MVVKSLVGHQWDMVYKEQPRPEGAVHPQILLLLFTALDKLNEKVLAERGSEQRKATQKQAKETLEKAAKKLKHH